MTFEIGDETYCAICRGKIILYTDGKRVQWQHVNPLWYGTTEHNPRPMTKEELRREFESYYDD